MILWISFALAHDPLGGDFDSLDPLWPTPNEIRTASGRVGSKYWQQQADYEIHVRIDEKTQNLSGSENIVYTNNSPDTLPYLWLQLDPNILSNMSERERMHTAPHLAQEKDVVLHRIPTTTDPTVEFDTMKSYDQRADYDVNLQISNVQINGIPVTHFIDSTQMRINLPKKLEPHEQVTISLTWSYNINDAKVLWARSGYEYFPKEDNYIFEMAQFFPRMCIYTDQSGWLTKEFLGDGEFATEFGNYHVYITVPADHIVGATGVLQNPKEVLSNKQAERLRKAATSPEPMFIVTPTEALERSASTTSVEKTWYFVAENVRDFAFGSSRKFIWDAWGREIDGKTVMAMSFYPNEAEPLWNQFSTHVVAHTLQVYSKMVLPYPYPVAISMNGPIYGMEYPMLSFNGPRPLEDKTYYGYDGPWKNQKYGLISVIIHEVGHNWFPMIINTDERSWTWMDEGLNTYVQLFAEQEWEENYPIKRGEAQNITTYMKDGSQDVPIMSDADSLRQKGNNAYAKPATALHILRNTVVGPENFDYVFRSYAQEWAFKRPYPADFFRLIEDASGKDLDWFWRSWFYTTNHVDVAIKNVQVAQKWSHDPVKDNAIRKENHLATQVETKISQQKPNAYYTDLFPSTKDFYSSYDAFTVTEEDMKKYDAFVEELKKHNATDKLVYTSDQYYNIITIENVSSMPTPVILEIEFANTTKIEYRIPAHVWRQHPTEFSKLIISTSPVVSVLLDPHLETGDTNRTNNAFPQRIEDYRFTVEPKPPLPSNPMQNQHTEP